ncbi:UNVERIFIED_CONTAM: hypothetical protein H355_012654 [Colinus virginianus]|nr:hypothetical protein H355_012654 [Colinus virginianus]
MEGSASPLASASAPLASMASTVTKVNAISPVEMEENVWVRINASAPKATKETSVQNRNATKSNAHACSVAAVCEPGCGLYGTCAEPNKCHCKEGWHGRHCNKRYGAGGLSALRPASTKHRQYTPSPKKADERHAPPESNYIW